MADSPWTEDQEATSQTETPLAQGTDERMPGSAGSGGLLFNQEEVARQRKLVREFVKSMGYNLLEGKDIISTSLPVGLFEARSYLQRLTDPFAYAQLLLRAAAATSDPVERIKYVVAYSIAGLHTLCEQRKPFNPILGETYQGTFPDGGRVFCEQVAHHPPISSWDLVGPNNSYRHYGGGEWKAAIRGTGLRGHQDGVNRVEFPDGTTIAYIMPYMYIKGIVFGDRIIEYDGYVFYVDEKNKIGVDLKFNAFAAGFWKGWFGKAPDTKPSDYFRGEVFEVEQNPAPAGDAPADLWVKKKVIGNCYGTWLGFVEFDNKKYWHYRDHPYPGMAKAVDDPLPSDCRFRADLCRLSEGDLEGASVWKAKLENRQRRDRKLRKEGSAMRKRGASADEIQRSMAQLTVDDA